MFARVAVYEVPGHRVGEAIEKFRDAIAQIREMGPEEVFVLVSAENDRALTMSVWDQQEVMEASRIKASRLRSDASNAVGGSVQSVVEYQVVIHERIGS